MRYNYDTTTHNVMRLRMMWYDYDTTTYDVMRLRMMWYDYDTTTYDVIRLRWCDTTMIRPHTMWCDYGDVTVYCSTTLLRLRNVTNATTLEIACPKLKAVIEERWWNRRAWNILIPHFPTFFLVCSEEEDSLWIELFPILSGREFLQ